MPNSVTDSSLAMDIWLYFSSGCLDTETETVHLLVNYPIHRLVRYDYNGVIRDSDLRNADIIGSWDD